MCFTEQKPTELKLKRCILQNCVTSLGNSKAKNEDPQSPLEIPLPFSLTPGISTLFFQYPCKFHVYNPSVWIFFWNSSFVNLSVEVREHWRKLLSCLGSFGRKGVGVWVNLLRIENFDKAFWQNSFSIILLSKEFCIQFLFWIIYQN